MCIYKYIFIGLKHVETTNFPGEPGPISLGARLLPTLCDDEEPWISVDLGEVKALSHVVLLWGEFSPSRYFIQGTDGQRMGDIVFLNVFSPFCWWIIFSPQRLGDFVKLFLEFVVFKPCSALYKSGSYMILSEN